MSICETPKKIGKKWDDSNFSQHEENPVTHTKKFYMRDTDLDILKKNEVVPYPVRVDNCVKRNDLSQYDKSTNRGLISEDRSTEATLLFTIPRSCLSRLHRIYL